MEEGLFQLIFILLIFVAAIFDSIARNRKKRERMEEMEREEAEARAEREGPAGSAVDSSADPDEPRWETTEWEPTQWEQESKPETREPSEPEPKQPEAGGRETADRMVPEDLWAILTGQEPPVEQERKKPPEEPPARREERPARPTPRARDPVRPPRTEAPPARRDDPDRELDERLGRRSDPDPPKDPHIPQPVPGDRLGTRQRDRARGEADVAARKTDRSMRETLGDIGEDLTERAEEAWGSVPDISAGEIGTEGGATPTEGEDRKRRFPRPGAGRRRPASRYARLLEEGDRESLREAVVLKEVLDVPMARRKGFGGWEEEER